MNIKRNKSRKLKKDICAEYPGRTYSEDRIVVGFLMGITKIVAFQLLSSEITNLNGSLTVQAKNVRKIKNVKAFVYISEFVFFKDNLKSIFFRVRNRLSMPLNSGCNNFWNLNPCKSMIIYNMRIVMQKKSEVKGMSEISKQKFGTYVSLFNEVWNESKPLAKLFRTSKRAYIYDTGTNKIMGCDEFVFELLHDLYSLGVETAFQSFREKHGEDVLLHAAESIKKAIEKQNILKFKKAEKFKLTGDKYDIDALIREHLEMIILEVTERCNLRCGYCIQEHGTNDMDPDVMKKAILYLKTHSPKNERVGIVLYGGEPVLCFSSISGCVEYAKQLFRDKGLDFSVTTNGTLVTPEIARFFKKNDFLVLVSIDGPAQIHQRFRKYKNGRGSYENAVRGLRYLVEAYGDSAEEKLKLSMVYTPPYSSSKLDEIDNFWEENNWMPANLGATITYPVDGSIPPEFFLKDRKSEDKTLMEWAFDKFRKRYNNGGKSGPLVDSAIEPSLNMFMQRPLYNEPEKSINLNGCCVPGARRLYVTADGSFKVCERIDSTAVSVGNVFSGLDMEALKTNYVNQYMEASFPECSTCWAARLCNSCFRDAFKDGVFDLRKKRRNCLPIMISKETYLEYFCTLMEDNPNGLDYLLERKIK